MKKESYIFSVLVMPYKDGGYIAMCKETGLIRNGKNLKEAHDSLISAMKLLISNVVEDESLEPSLSVGLPFRYLVLFHWTIVKLSFLSMIDSFEFRRSTLQEFQVNPC